MNEIVSPLIVGIDPGVTGAIALVDGDARLLDVVDHEAIVVGKGAKRRLDLNHFARAIKSIASDWAPPTLIVVEVQQSMHKQGVASTFTCGYGYGAILGVLTALEEPYSLVRPRDWKAAMRLGSASKSEARQTVMSRFPGQSDRFKRARDHNRAEAVLIALWGLRSLNHAPSLAALRRRM